jgi:hypothetical protein
MSAAAVIGWTAISFAAMSVGLNWWLNHGHLAVRHAEFAQRVELLDKLQKRSGERPLCLVVGSSRAERGICPAVLQGDQRAPLLFNFSFAAAGPISELMYFQRLIDLGVRPKWLLIDVPPLWLHQDDSWNEEAKSLQFRLEWEDLPYLGHLLRDPWEGWLSCLEGRIAPAYAYRFGLLDYFCPSWLPPLERDKPWRQRMDEFGWLRFLPPTVADRRERMKEVKEKLQAGFENYHITEHPKEAIEAMIKVSRANGVEPIVIVMPENSEFRSWYSPDAVAQIKSYLDELREREHVRVQDYRFSLDDQYFTDGQHLHEQGSWAFTHMLNQTLLQTLNYPASADRAVGTERPSATP